MQAGLAIANKWFNTPVAFLRNYACKEQLKALAIEASILLLFPHTSSADSSSFHLLSGVFLSSLVSLCAAIDLMSKGLLVVKLCTTLGRAETRVTVPGKAHTLDTEARSAQDISDATATLSPTMHEQQRKPAKVRL